MTDLPKLPDLPPLEPHPSAAPAVADEWTATKTGRRLKVPIPAAALVIIAVALLGLWGGAQLKGSSPANASTSTPATGGRTRNGAFAGGGGTGGAGGGAGRGGTIGTVKSVDGNTITITTANGGTATVTIGSSTTVTKSETGSVSDITPGENIVVRGTTGTDGTTTAQSINVGNAPFGFGGGGQGGPPTTSAAN